MKVLADPLAEVEETLRAHRATRARRRDLLLAAFPETAFVAVDAGGRRTLVIRSGEMQHPEQGRWRATLLEDDGPRGHVTSPTDEDLAERLAEFLMPVAIEPIDEAGVIAWTSTPAFAEGAARVAAIQAENERRRRR